MKRIVDSPMMLSLVSLLLEKALVEMMITIKPMVEPNMIII